ncbi:YgiQ family radical SAM protein [Thioalkalivibrio sp. ALE9]|uniref:YgiQ family radical SAM protein n=1 Tax=Thioalkalivibrio sp. ALE9 TaxID=1158169 RepID=UPI00036B2E0B|nr:YgiQ family radical SAM protein [Thioalkalivibrio sp. ALE9]
MSAAPETLFARKPYWAKRFGTAPFLPTTREEMDALGWDSCDIVLVTGDAYVDHPSFGMAIIGRLLEAQGFRVGILAQPDWTSAEPFRALGRPNLFFGVTAGNMDSMVNHYTAERKVRSNDAYTPGDVHGKRPDRAVIVYAQRVREAYKDVPVVAGGIEASLRRIAHYDYWQDKVRRSVLLDSRADILLFGNAERALVELAHRVAAGEHPREITDLRGTAFLRDAVPAGFVELDSSEVDTPGPVDANPDPYAMVSTATCADAEGQDSSAVQGEPGTKVVRFQRQIPRGTPRDQTVIRIPAFEQVKGDAVLYAHASRVLHLETNPGNARAIVQRHGDKEVWLNPPPIPLSTPEMDAVFDLPYARAPHPAYGDARIPAWEMIRFSVNIMRGCFGGCTFCSITEHEGRIIQSRSEDSVLREIEEIRDKVDGFTGVISDLGGPTANMYRLACKDPKIEQSCRRLSCVYPGICSNLDTDHAPLIRLYRKARALPGIKKILIASGLRYDLAIESPEYVKELVTHHVGGYLKIAPEHTEKGPLSRMMKPGMGTYDRFKAMFEKYSKAAGKEQYLIPYFIAAHPGTTDQDMLQLALWLKRNGFRADQVQAFLPSPMALATAMWHSGRDPLRGIRRKASERVPVARGFRARRLHKAFLRYHDPNNWPLLRDALQRMGRADLIGNGKHHLVPTWQPAGTGQGAARPSTGGRMTRGGKALKKRGQTFQTQHNGVEAAARPGAKPKAGAASAGKAGGRSPAPHGGKPRAGAGKLRKKGRPAGKRPRA